MTSAYDNEELPLPLLHRTSGRARIATEDDIPTAFYDRERPREEAEEAKTPRTDRLRPASAGALMGLLAGAASLGVVHAFHPARIGQGIARISGSMAGHIVIPAQAAVPLAYLAVALAGALIGAGFASMTKHLRRSFFALLLWALVFFGSVTMLALAMSSAYGRGLGVSMAPAILLAAAAYAFVVSFQLPLRRRA